MAHVSPPDANRPYVLITADGETHPLDIGADVVADLFRQHGALIFRGFALDIDGFRGTTEHFCSSSVFNESGGRRVLDTGGNIQSVNLGSEAFPLHPELSREPWKPDVAFFYCIDPPKAQGQTTLCDGIALAAAMPDEIRDGLAGRRLIYTLPASAEHLEYWLGTSRPSDAQLAAPPPNCPYNYMRGEKGVTRSFSRPALHTPLFSDAPAFGNFLLFARYHNQRTGFPALDDGSAVPDAWLDVIRDLGDQLSVEVGWQAQDLVMLDNSRFMHGRTAIIDPDARLIATHFGYLRFVSRNPEDPADPIWRRQMFRPPAQGRSAA